MVPVGPYLHLVRYFVLEVQVRKLCLSLVAAGALVGSLSSASAFEAMLGGSFALHPQPHSHQYIVTLGAGDIVNINSCDRGWCAVTHGPHVGYIYLNRILDGRVYGPRGGAYGYRDGGLAEVGANVVAAPFNAAGNVLDTGFSILR
jgi:hypothetical protein